MKARCETTKPMKPTMKIVGFSHAEGPPENRVRLPVPKMLS